MLTYTKQRNTFGKMVGNSNDTATLAIADDMCNIEMRQVLSKRVWWFFEKAFTLTTQASVQAVQIPGDIDRIISNPYVTVSSMRYTPREVPSRDMWNMINIYSVTSDIPEWWYYYAGALNLFPIPASAGNTVTINAKQRVVDLSMADYTTGTIVTVSTTGTTTTVTGSGTTWADGMIGQWIRITRTAATKGGDGIWYQIATVPSSTSLTLVNPYGGTALAGASAAYTIGQCSILPEAYQELPMYRALSTYFTSVDADETKAALYGGKAKALLDQLEADHSNRTGGRVLDYGLDQYHITNPNLTIGF